MTVDRKTNEITNLRDGVVDAIDGMFALCEAVEKHNLTVDDLANGCNLAIAEGHYKAVICLVMMTRAVEISGDGQPEVKELE